MPDTPQPTLPESIQHIETLVLPAVRRVDRVYVLLAFGIFAVYLASMGLLFVFWLATMQSRHYLLWLDFLPTMSVVMGLNLIVFAAFVVLWHRSRR